jgi:hypothetical protein
MQHIPAMLRMQHRFACIDPDPTLLSKVSETTIGHSCSYLPVGLWPSFCSAFFLFCEEIRTRCLTMQQAGASLPKKPRVSR